MDPKRKQYMHILDQVSSGFSILSSRLSAEREHMDSLARHLADTAAELGAASVRMSAIQDKRKLHRPDHSGLKL